MTQRFAILGWGSQARAWAHNLRDSGWDLAIYLREQSPSFPLVQAAGLQAYLNTDDRLHQERQLALLVPDGQHELALEQLAPRLDQGTLIILAHGYSFEAFALAEKFPQLRFGLLAPKAIASELRQRYQEKKSLAAVYAALTEPEEKQLQELAQALGITYLVSSSFAEETKADLFSEQSLLCSLLPYGAKKSFDLLVEKGISPEVAYLECWMELKLIADAMIAFGPEGFFKLISPNALVGAQKAKQLLLDDQFDSKLEQLFDDIEAGRFYEQTKTTDEKAIRQQVLKELKTSLLQQTHHRLHEHLKDS